MKLLLDTHALLWALLDSECLSVPARKSIAAESNELLISAVSAMELATKFRLGKLGQAPPFMSDGRIDLGDIAWTPLPISFEHASLGGSLQIAHKDPFDRLLIAQALVEGVPIVSNEALFDGFGVQRVW